MKVSNNKSFFVPACLGILGILMLAISNVKGDGRVSMDAFFHVIGALFIIIGFFWAMSIRKGALSATTQATPNTAKVSGPFSTIIMAVSVVLILASIFMGPNVFVPFIIIMILVGLFIQYAPKSSKQNQNK